MVTGDPKLAEHMRKWGVKAPTERIIQVDWLATAFNDERLKRGERIVDLECGHKAVTKNRKRAQCYDCHEMILNGEDYEAFRFRKEDQ